MDKKGKYLHFSHKNKSKKPQMPQMPQMPQIPKIFEISKFESMPFDILLVIIHCITLQDNESLVKLAIVFSSNASILYEIIKHIAKLSSDYYNSLKVDHSHTNFNSFYNPYEINYDYMYEYIITEDIKTIIPLIDITNGGHIKWIHKLAKNPKNILSKKKGKDFMFYLIYNHNKKLGCTKIASLLSGYELANISEFMNMKIIGIEMRIFDILKSILNKSSVKDINDLSKNERLLIIRYSEYDSSSRFKSNSFKIIAQALSMNYINVIKIIIHNSSFTYFDDDQLRDMDDELTEDEQYYNDRNHANSLVHHSICRYIIDNKRVLNMSTIKLYIDLMIAKIGFSEATYLLFTFSVHSNDINMIKYLLSYPESKEYISNSTYLLHNKILDFIKLNNL